VSAGCRTCFSGFRPSIPEREGHYANDAMASLLAIRCALLRFFRRGTLNLDPIL
jgi:hypothetical protein